MLPGTKVGWRGVAIRQRFETLRCVTYVRSPVKVLGKNRLELALLCARVPSLLHSLANWSREEAGTTTCFSSLHRAIDKHIGKIKKGASFPF